MAGGTQNWWESWWFVGIIVGLAINLASSYIKPVIDKWWGKYSERQRQKNLVNSAEFEEKVQEMLDDQTEFMYVLSLLNQAVVLTPLGMGLTIGGIVRNSWDGAVLTLGGLVIVFSCISFVSKYQKLVNEYRKRKKDIRLKSPG